MRQTEEEALLRLRDDPALFAKTWLGLDWWPKQAQIAQAIQEHARVAVKACHASSKTHTAAGIALWFLTTHYPSVVITTAPTYRQVSELLWREMRHMYRTAKGPMIGRFLDSPRWEVDANWYALGISTKEPDAFQGHHSRNIMVIVDEAAGVSESIFEAIEGIVSTQDAKVLLIGNPTSQSGTFHAAFHGARSRYRCITISAFDTPNFQGQVVRPYLVTPDWVQEQRARWGESSPFYQSRVLGEFPRQGIDTLIPLQFIEDAQQRWHDMPDGQPIEIGVDVARYGQDETVICTRFGGKVLQLQCFHSQDTMETTGRVIEAFRAHPAMSTKIDVVGIGAGVFDRLNEQGIYRVASVESGARARDPAKYVNLRAEMWDGMKSLLQSGLVGLPPDEVLAGQLSSVKYRFDSAGRMVLESKEDMAKRGIGSPDRADAVVYAFADIQGGHVNEDDQETEPSKWGSGREGRSRWR